MDWTVKELTDRSGISTKKLRNYHRIGLLLREPAAVLTFDKRLRSVQLPLEAASPESQFSFGTVEWRTDKR